MFTVKIKTDNAAFEESPHAEIIACLQRIIARLDGSDCDGPVMDSNGNKVGSFDYTETETDR